MPLTFVFHGPSGAGKDTQVDLLEDKISFERIGGSAVMRALLAEENELALKADEFGKRGELYPDELMFGMLGEWARRLSSDANWFFLSPVRKSTQIDLFEKLLDDHSRKLDLFIHFKLSEEAAIERMSLRRVCSKCGEMYHMKYKKPKIEGVCDVDGAELVQREDDQPESIKKRLEWYNSDIDPILTHYEEEGKLLEIDASPSIEDIHTDLMSKIAQYV